MYELNWGISNPVGTNIHPFAKVAANPTEDVLSGNRFEKAFKSFSEADVLNQTGISFDKAMALPVYQFKQLCELSRAAAEAKAKQSTSYLKDQAKKSGLPPI